MKKIFLLDGLMGAGCLLRAHEKLRLQVFPIDIQPGAVDGYLTSIDQIETDGSLLYLRSRKEPRVVVIRADGVPVREIGGSGQGPGKMGEQGPVAMALWGQDLFVLANDRQQMQHFVDGAYAGSFRIDSFVKILFSPSANNFALSADRVVVPNDPKAKGRAAVYDHLGQRLGSVGESIDFGPDLVARVPGMNDSHWVRDDHFFYCLSTFHPLITTYSLDLKKVAEAEIKSPVAQAVWKQVRDFEPPPDKPGFPFPVVTDAQAHDGWLYAMIGGAIHQINPRTGEVLASVNGVPKTTV